LRQICGNQTEAVLLADILQRFTCAGPMADTDVTMNQDDDKRPRRTRWAQVMQRSPAWQRVFDAYRAGRPFAPGECPATYLASGQRKAWLAHQRRVWEFDVAKAVFDIACEFDLPRYVTASACMGGRELACRINLPESSVRLAIAHLQACKLLLPYEQTPDGRYILVPDLEQLAELFVQRVPGATNMKWWQMLQIALVHQDRCDPKLMSPGKSPWCNPGKDDACKTPVAMTFLQEALQHGKQVMIWRPYLYLVSDLGPEGDKPADWTTAAVLAQLLYATDCPKRMGVQVISLDAKHDGLRWSIRQLADSAGLAPVAVYRSIIKLRDRGFLRVFTTGNDRWGRQRCTFWVNGTALRKALDHAWEPLNNHLLLLKKRYRRPLTTVCPPAPHEDFLAP
jgi:hypothetical protein